MLVLTIYIVKIVTAKSRLFTLVAVLQYILLTLLLCYYDRLLFKAGYEKMVKKNNLLCKRLSVVTRLLTPATMVTLSRIAITPFVVTAIANHQWQWGFFLLFVAGVSDGLDGFLARSMGHETVLGRLLDPIADKILIVSTFAALALASPSELMIPFWFVWLLVGREACMLIGSVVMVVLGRKHSGDKLVIAPTMWGKLTTCVQLLFIGWLLLCYFFSWVPARTYSISFAIVLLLSFGSFVQYASIALRFIFSVVSCAKK